MHAVRSVAVAGAIALLLGACGDDGRPGRERSGGTATSESSATSTTAAATTTTVDPYVNFVAESVVPVIEVFDAPGALAPIRTLDVSDELRGKLVFLVEAEQEGWLHVQLPVRPNGSTGWVRTQDVTVTQHTYRIVIELGAHQLTLFGRDQIVLREPIGVGKNDTPTPGGEFYIKELLQPPDPTGPYGPYAYGLSGFSNVLTSFAGGAGVIGIHGTNRPDLIGTDVSSGCIRVHNDVINRMVAEIGLPLGTPVEILT